MHIDITDHVDRPVDELIDLVTNIEVCLDHVRTSLRNGDFTEAHSQGIVTGIFLERLAQHYPTERPLVAEPTADEAA